MGKNVEIKAQLPEGHLARITECAASLATEGPVLLLQTDTFFQVPKERLKLREFPDREAELIAYSRSDTESAKLSQYTRVPVAHPQELKFALRDTIGIRGIIRKRRTLFLVGQTRIHLDEVEELGAFLELEVVLREDQTQEEGTQIANRLMQTLEISPDWLISGAYIDLLDARLKTTATI